MFDDYAKKIKEIGANAPAVFKKVAKMGAVHFVNEAEKITDKEGLVDTGNYKRNWFAKQIEPQNDVYGVLVTNNAEYSNHLEYGHKLRNGKRWKGRFVGRQALDDTRYYCITKLDDIFDKLYTQHQKGFIKPDSE